MHGEFDLRAEQSYSDNVGLEYLEWKCRVIGENPEPPGGNKKLWRQNNLLITRDATVDATRK